MLKDFTAQLEQPRADAILLVARAEQTLAQLHAQIRVTEQRISASKKLSKELGRALAHNAVRSAKAS